MLKSIVALRFAISVDCKLQGNLEGGGAALAKSWAFVYRLMLTDHAVCSHQPFFFLAIPQNTKDQSSPTQPEAPVKPQV